MINPRSGAHHIWRNQCLKSDQPLKRIGGLLPEPPGSSARTNRSAACRYQGRTPTRPRTGSRPSSIMRLPFRQRAPAASEHRPLVLSGFLERTRPDPCAAAGFGRGRQLTGPRPSCPPPSPDSTGKIIRCFESTLVRYSRTASGDRQHYRCRD